MPLNRTRRRPASRIVVPVWVLGLCAGAAACGRPVGLSPADHRVQVVTTTGLLRDLVENVGGARVRAVSLVPDGADPHTYEPSIRAVRDVVYADAAFSNYLLLEPRAVVATLDSNLPDDAVNVPLAEESVRYAADLIPMVEDVTLDTPWLGLRVRGDGADLGADRTSEVEMTATGHDGPGRLVEYLTGSLGNTDVLFDSADGFRSDRSRAAGGDDTDTVTLPPGAHSHMSWAFARAGIHRLHLRARLRGALDEDARDVGTTTISFVVGVDPSRLPAARRRDVVDAGHVDITADLDTGRMVLLHDPAGTGERVELDPASTVIVVPHRARQEVPEDPSFRFLGPPGRPLFQLPQAVLGRHVHGEIDPHVWHDVDNVIAYVALIRDTLTRVDAAGAEAYRRNAAAYIRRLEDVDAEVRRTIEEIPPSRRHLVTTHDAFRYLARAYGLEVSGFVTPNPSVEPSLADRRRLAATVRGLRVPAVFVEPNLAARASMLTEVAADAGIEVCTIRGDILDEDAPTYVDLMLQNARSLRRCLQR